MKIERLSENQIRCTLNKNDLIDRELKISELAYGTEKAKSLFRDMMTQASYELGFEADDIPLIIEAIPVSGECIILIVTKVEDPDELDTRFAKFSSYAEDNETDSLSDADEIEYKGADEIIDLFKKLGEDIITGDLSDSENIVPVPKKAKKTSGKAEPKGHNNSDTLNLSKVFTFKTLDNVMTFASIIVNKYNGNNTLYKDLKAATYYLVLWKGDYSPREFNKVCNTAAEYGKRIKTSYATLAYYQEHFDIIVKDKAIQVLSNI